MKQCFDRNTEKINKQKKVQLSSEKRSPVFIFPLINKNWTSFCTRLKMKTRLAVVVTAGINLKIRYLTVNKSHLSQAEIRKWILVETT